MKVTVQFAAAILLIILVFNSSVKAQDGMKKLPDVTVTSSTNVSKKVSDYFKAHFPDAENPRWTKLNKNYLVEFITADIKNNVLFRRSGTIIYHIKYGAEKNLPEDIRRLVKSNYYMDYEITKAINVLQDNRSIWLVNLQDAKKYVIVRVEGGELEEVSSLVKSS